MKRYSKEILEPESFVNIPSTTSQFPLGFLARPVENDPIKKSVDITFPNSRYTFLRKKSDGSAGKLYLARDNEQNKNVMIKKINKNEDWRKEIVVLKKLKDVSEKILKVIDHFESDRSVYIVCEYIESYDFFSHVVENAPYSIERARELLKEMIMCVWICHQNNVAHLDIKCENFIYQPKNLSNPFVLIDFGHSEIIEPNVIKRMGTSYGTTFYLCPEGFDGYYSTKSDIWAIGICAHLLISGDYPFYGEEDDEYEESILSFKRTIDKNIPEDAYDFIQKCLHYDARKRPTIEELLFHPFITDNEEQ